MMREDFAIFILSHGRANNVITLKTMNMCNYTGKWYIVVDNEDKQYNDYCDNFGKEHIIMFDKLKKAQEFDTCDLLSRSRNAIVYARNACFDIAKQLGLKYFLEFDDDYIEFRSRIEKDGTLSSIFVQDMDSIINETLEFLDKSGALTIAWSQMGDFIGGLDCSMYRNRITRKAMNSFFCRTDKPFDFVGRINEDVNTYVWRASRGELMFTIADVSLNQVDTQQNKGGMTDFYLDSGTYIKSFYSIIINPSSVKIGEIGVDHKRFHHSVDWEHCCPKIINERYKKYE